MLSPSILEVSNNFKAFKPNSPKQGTKEPKEDAENSNPTQKNPNQTNHKPSTNPAPPVPIVSHALVTKLRAQEAMKTTRIPINPP